MATLRANVVVVGDATVGKTSLIKSFESNGQEFPKHYTMTQGCEITQKTIKIPDSQNIQVELQIYDMGGQTIYKDIVTELCKRSSMVVLVYDISNRDSFKALPYWLKTFEECAVSLLTGVVVANKVDIEDRIQVPSEEGQNYAHSGQLEFFECSALKYKDVDMPFNLLADVFYKTYEERIEQIKTACLM